MLNSITFNSESDIDTIFGKAIKFERMKYEQLIAQTLSAQEEDRYCAMQKGAERALIDLAETLKYSLLPESINSTYEDFLAWKATHTSANLMTEEVLP